MHFSCNFIPFCTVFIVAFSQIIFASGVTVGSTRHRHRNKVISASTASVEGFPEAGFSVPLENRVTPREGIFAGALETGHPLIEGGPSYTFSKPKSEEIDISRVNGQLSRHVIPPLDPNEPTINDDATTTCIIYTFLLYSIITRPAY